MSKTATDLSSLKSGLDTSISEYASISIDDDRKLKTLQILIREFKLLTDEEKRLFDQQIQTERAELDKDHKYWSEKFEEKKFTQEQELNNKRFELESKKFEILTEIEKEKLKIENYRLASELQSKKDEQKYRYISLGITIGVPLIMNFVTLLVYRKLSYDNLRLIYRDEGRPTVDFKDSVKLVRNLIK